MTILVCNANGKVGQEVARALLAAGEKLRIGARNRAGAQAGFPGAEIVGFDYTQPATLAAAMQGVEAIFSAAPYELEPGATRALIAAAEAAGVKRFVKLSALGAEADPNSPHSLAETALAKSGLEWTVLRPTFFMQNYCDEVGGIDPRRRHLRARRRRRHQLHRHPRHRRRRGDRADQARA